MAHAHVRLRRRAARRSSRARLGRREHGLAGRRRSGSSSGDTRHVTIDRALRLLGLGASAARRRDADDAGAHASRRAARGARASGGPTIVCAQAGEVNTGVVRPVRRRSPTIVRDDGRLAARRRRLRALGRGEPARSPPRRGRRAAPTRGRPTGTSGSTCRTTAGSRSCAHPDAASRVDATHGVVPRRGQDAASRPMTRLDAGVRRGARAASRSTRPALARPLRRRRARRPLLRPRAPHSPSSCRALDGLRGPERGRPQPGALPLRRRRD